MLRFVLVIGASVFLASGASMAADSRLLLPMMVGTTPVPKITVGAFLHCVAHDPIPRRLSGLDDEGNGTFIVRATNDLQQLTMSFKVTGARATLVKLERDNGTTLRYGKGLLPFVKLSCAQARS